eukprot:jgi/Botrbrau1/7317/Bobra.247_3s0012.1
MFEHLFIKGSTTCKEDTYMKRNALDLVATPSKFGARQDWMWKGQDKLDFWPIVRDRRTGEEMLAPAFVDPAKARNFALEHYEGKRNPRGRKGGSANNHQSEPASKPPTEVVAPQTPPPLKPLAISTPSPARPTSLTPSVPPDASPGAVTGGPAGQNGLRSARGYVLVRNVPKGATSDHIVSFFDGYSALRAGVCVLKDTLDSSLWTLVVQFKSKAAGEEAVADLDDGPFPMGQVNCKLQSIEVEDFQSMATVSLREALEGSKEPQQGSTRSTVEGSSQSGPAGTSLSKTSGRSYQGGSSKMGRSSHQDEEGSGYGGTPVWKPPRRGPESGRPYATLRSVPRGYQKGARGDPASPVEGPTPRTSGWHANGLHHQNRSTSESESEFKQSFQQQASHHEASRGAVEGGWRQRQEDPRPANYRNPPMSSRAHPPGFPAAQTAHGHRLDDTPWRTANEAPPPRAYQEENGGQWGGGKVTQENTARSDRAAMFMENGYPGYPASTHGPNSPPKMRDFVPPPPPPLAPGRLRSEAPPFVQGPVTKSGAWDPEYPLSASQAPAGGIGALTNSSARPSGLPRVFGDGYMTWTEWPSADCHLPSSPKHAEAPPHPSSNERKNVPPGFGQIVPQPPKSSLPAAGVAMMVTPMAPSGTMGTHSIKDTDKGSKQASGAGLTAARHAPAQIANGYTTSDDEKVMECPLTLELMEDPVIAADGYTYERNAITEWLNKGKTTSPMTGEPLSDTKLVPNHYARSQIQRWREVRQAV